MVRHNNIIPNQHFHKDWAKRVKTWFQQPIQKKIRAQRRKEKAARLAPRPASGPLRPVVHCQTQKYNTRVRAGRGFTLEELKEAGIPAKLARTIGITVDHRRSNKCAESLQLNAQRLKEYKSRLIIFPRKAGQPKNGDSSPEELASATQITGPIIPITPTSSAFSYAPITEEMKAFRAHNALRAAMNDSKLYGKRLTKKVTKESGDGAADKE